MRVTRVFVAAELATGRRVSLPRETAAHLSKVLRARSGDPVTLFAGDNREFSAVLETVSGAAVTAMIGAGAIVDRESPLGITLVQCLPRNDRMDLIVQKSTELGVRRIVPVLSQRSVVRLDAAQAESKVAHWRTIAVGACEQCGRNRIPIIDTPVDLRDYLGRAAAAPRTRWVLAPDPVRKGAVGAVDDPGAAPSGLEIAVGPEGGLAEDELEWFRVAGFARLGLGPRILRTETAALAAVAWAQTRFGDLRPAEDIIP